MVITDPSPLFLIKIAEDHQIDEIHRNIQNIDIADPTAETISIEIITLYRTLIEVISLTVTKRAHIQTPGKETIQLTAQEFLQRIAIAIIQLIVMKTTLIIDHKIF